MHLSGIYSIRHGNKPFVYPLSSGGFPLQVSILQHFYPPSSNWKETIDRNQPISKLTWNQGISRCIRAGMLKNCCKKCMFQRTDKIIRWINRYPAYNRVLVEVICIRREVNLLICWVTFSSFWGTEGNWRGWGGEHVFIGRCSSVVGAYCSLAIGLLLIGGFWSLSFTPEILPSTVCFITECLWVVWLWTSTLLPLCLLMLSWWGLVRIAPYRCTIVGHGLCCEAAEVWTHIYDYAN